MEILDYTITWHAYTAPLGFASCSKHINSLSSAMVSSTLNLPMSLAPTSTTTTSKLENSVKFLRTYKSKNMV